MGKKKLLDNVNLKSKMDGITYGMKVRWKGEAELFSLTNGKIYEVISVEKGWYRIVDESGEDYLYPPEFFEIVNQ